MEFKTSFDWAAKSVITFVTLLFTTIIVFYKSQPVTSMDALPLSFSYAFTVVLLIGIYVGCYLYQPQKYVINSGKIIVKRPFKDKVIEISTVKEVYTIEKDTMGWVLRTFGNGGLFGFYGRFRSDRYGDMTWYATRRSNYVMLETNDHQKIVLTPDDLNMAKEIKKLIGQ